MTTDQFPNIPHKATRFIMRFSIQFNSKYVSVWFSSIQSWVWIDSIVLKVGICRTLSSQFTLSCIVLESENLKFPIVRLLIMIIMTIIATFEILNRFHGLLLSSENKARRGFRLESITHIFWTSLYYAKFELRSKLEHIVC